jgi:hypothetical protein
MRLIIDDVARNVLKARDRYCSPRQRMTVISRNDV